MEQMRRELVADLRELIIICCLSAKWEEKGKITRDEAYGILKKGMFKADSILRSLAEKTNV